VCLHRGMGVAVRALRKDVGTVLRRRQKNAIMEASAEEEPKMALLVGTVVEA
jgi:hypothetical protein